MTGTFSAIETAKSAMMAHQEAVAVAAHNVANASVKGYSRQEPVFKTRPAPGGVGLSFAGQRAGMGVDVAAVLRARNVFLDAQVRSESSRLGYYSVLSRDLSQVEVVLNEPSDGGLAASMQNLWDAFYELSLNPESIAARRSVIEQAKALGEAFKHVRKQLTDLMADIEVRISSAVDRINSIATEIASLNGRIQKLVAAGKEANDLMDKRDLLLDELARFGKVQCNLKPSGACDVYLGDGLLVSEMRYQTLEVYSEESGDITGLTLIRIRWVQLQTQASLGIGEIQASLDTRNQEIPSVITSLGTLEGALREEVNGLHYNGYGLDGVGERNLFQPLPGGVPPDGETVNPWGLQINPDIDAHPEWLAASSEPLACGNGENALKMAQIGKTAINALEGANPGEYYRSMLVALAIQCREAKEARDAEESLVGHLEDLRESYIGVSTDEEVADMLRFEKAFSAAAKLVSVVNDMIGTMIEVVGNA